MSLFEAFFSYTNTRVNLLMFLRLDGILYLRMEGTHLETAEEVLLLSESFTPKISANVYYVYEICFYLTSASTKLNYMTINKKTEVVYSIVLFFSSNSPAAPCTVQFCF
jgi:hypothetical protein